MLTRVYNRMTRLLFRICFGTPRSESIGVRHVQMVLLFFGLLLAYAMRVNMSIAIVAMTDKNDETTFQWNMQKQSIILSSFFWGYICLQIPAGELANRFGGKVLLALSIGINSAVLLFLPLCAYYGGWKMVCLCRVIQGVSQGVIYPSVHNILGKWVPSEEKNRLGTFTYAGSYLGTALQLTTAGFIADRWGWPMIFYSVGLLGSIWTFFYVQMGSSCPGSSNVIRSEERVYIQGSLGAIVETKKLQTPWKAILSSKPFLALTLVHCGQSWGFWTLLTEIPTYLNLVHGVYIQSNGILSALPYLTMYLLTFPLGFLTDYSLKKQWVSLSTSRKLSNSIGFYGAAAALIGISCIPQHNVHIAVILLIIAVGVNAGHITGFLLVHLDMSPNFAGTMMGITNFTANIISIVAPLVAGTILEDVTDLKEWRLTFYIAAAVYICTNTIFVLYGSCERQDWDQTSNEDISCIISHEGAGSKIEKVV